MITTSRAARGIFRHVLLIVIAALFAPLLSAGVANAHGEQTQEAFLRASTVLIYDVNFSKTGKVNIGDEVTITGNIRIMDSWPDHTIEAAEIGYLSIVNPGPKFLVKERWLNGQFTPQSVQIHKGQTFPFKLVIVAREEGRHHVHPSFAIEGTGTLVGRGEWFEVGPGELPNEVTLASGDRINVDSYGLFRVGVWHLIALGLGVAWMIFWLRRPVLARLPRVASGDTNLIRPLDKKVGIGLAVTALAVLVGGNVYASATAPIPPMPLQIDRIMPEPAAESEPLVESQITEASYNSGTDKLEFTLKVTNTTDSPVQLSQIQIAEVTFVPVGTKTNGTIEALEVTGGEIAPGEEKVLTVKINGATMKEFNLLPLREPQVRLTGLMFFTDAEGHRQVSEIDEVTSPIFPGK